MKSKDFFIFLVNPFTKIAGLKAFLIGLVFILAMGYIGALSGTYFDGVMDAHISDAKNFKNAFLFLAVDIVCLVVIMWIAGLIFSKNLRFVDILGTMTLSKAPLLILSLLGFIVDKKNISNIITDPFSFLADPGFIIFMIISIPVIIWNIVLMYNAFKVSCNIKGTKNIVVFIVALLIAETISKIIIFIII